MNFNFNYQLPLILQFKINQQWALGTPHSISACSTFWFTQKDLKQQVCWKLFLMGKKKNSQFCLIDRICVRVSRSLKWTKKLSQKPKYISYWVAFSVHSQSVTAEIASPEGKLVFSANYWRGVITIFFFRFMLIIAIIGWIIPYLLALATSFELFCFTRFMAGGVIAIFCIIPPTMIADLYIGKGYSLILLTLFNMIGSFGR